MVSPLSGPDPRTPEAEWYSISFVGIRVSRCRRPSSSPEGQKRVYRLSMQEAISIVMKSIAGYADNSQPSNEGCIAGTTIFTAPVMRICIGRTAHLGFLIKPP